MKFGILTFGYDSFTHFAEENKKNGYYTVNLGDNAQSIAIRALYKNLGITADEIIEINRDILTSYRGDRVATIMNGAFSARAFPLSPDVVPIFIGFQTTETVIKRFADMFRSHQPIGCRDIETTRAMLRSGIEAYTTGCATFAFSTRSDTPSEPKLFVVYGLNAGALPHQVLGHIPPDLLERTELIFHRLPTGKFPFDEERRAEAERYESALLDRYRREATLVLTPLHHVAAPCMAFGIPTIVCRNRPDARFSLIETIAPIYYPGGFETIDWRPTPVDISNIKSEFLRKATLQVQSARAKENKRAMVL